MKFTKNIFEEMKAIEPNTTNKDFSISCGMSDGYYGSVTSQGYEISDEAIINLMEWIERRKIAIAKYDPKNYTKVEHYQAIQQVLANELADRAHSQRQSNNNKIRALVLGAFANVYEKKYGANDGIPFVY